MALKKASFENIENERVVSGHRYDGHLMKKLPLFPKMLKICSACGKRRKWPCTTVFKCETCKRIFHKRCSKKLDDVCSVTYEDDGPSGNKLVVGMNENAFDDRLMSKVVAQATAIVEEVTNTAVRTVNMMIELTDPGLSTSSQGFSASPQVISTSSEGVSASPQVISASFEGVSEFSQVISASSEGVSASSQVISASSKGVSTSLEGVLKPAVGKSSSAPLKSLSMTRAASRVVLRRPKGISKNSKRLDSTSTGGISNAVQASTSKTKTLCQPPREISVDERSSSRHLVSSDLIPEVVLQNSD